MSRIALRSKSPEAQNASPMQMKPVIIRTHHSPVRSENATIRSKIPTKRNMNPMTEATATNAFSGWMNDMIPPTMSKHAEDRVERLPPAAPDDGHHAELDARRQSGTRFRRGCRSYFADVMLNRNMISDRISHSVPVIRNTHHTRPALSS